MGDRRSRVDRLIWVLDARPPVGAEWEAPFEAVADRLRDFWREIVDSAHLAVLGERRLASSCAKRAPFQLGHTSPKSMIAAPAIPAPLGTVGLVPITSRPMSSLGYLPRAALASLALSFRGLLGFP